MRLKNVFKICLLALLFGVQQGSAQDIHLSHIHASPTLLNPSLAGLFNGDIRLITNYRSQWQTFTNGYRTMVASADMKVARLGVYDFLGAGLQVYSDKAGDLDFTTNSASLILSFLKSLDNRDDHYISFGVKNTLVTNRVDYTNVVAFQSTANLGDRLGDETSYWDLSAGLSWFYGFDRYSYMYLGASYFHINDANVSLFKDRLPQGFESPTLYRKVVVHGGANFNLNWAFTLKPSFIFLDQGPHREISVGSFLKYNYDRQSKSKAKHGIYLGMWMRWYFEKELRGVDATVIALRFDINRTFITFSFDANISKLSVASSGVGGPELSMIHTFDLKRSKRKNSKIRCPSF